MWAVTFGFPIDRRHGFKLTYWRADTTEDTGVDYERVILGYSVMWGAS